MPTTLIQLISEQTVQNLLPVMRVKPERLVHLVTPKTERQSENVVRAVHALGLSPAIELVRLSNMPDIEETYRAVRDSGGVAQEQGDTVVVNFTGGTKLMGIGAFGAAMELKIPALYVDTQQGRFVPGDQQGRLRGFLNDNLELKQLADELSVEILAIANGMQRVTTGSDWSDQLPLARLLFADPALETKVHDAIHGRDGLCPGGREPRTAGEWLQILEQSIHLPEVVIPAAVAAGLVVAAGENVTLAVDAAEHGQLKELAEGSGRIGPAYFEAISPLQHRLAMLTGGWWEVIVADAMTHSGNFRDLRWSVQVGTPHGADQEEDLLAVEDLQLVFVSCKRSSAQQRSVAQMEEIHSRAATIGGRFNRRILAVLHRPGRATLEKMQEKSRLLGIELLFGDQIEGYF